MQLAAAFLVYTAISLALWWHGLSRGLPGGATTLLPSGSADPGQEVWFLGWLPHALGSGINPFFSRAIFAPRGVNLLANTSVDFVGLLLAPVTVTEGPVAAFWTAVFLAPALSALGAFALCRRHVGWGPAAFVGGLFYGFGPFIATDLRYGHLDLTWAVFPPLIFLCLDELLFSGRRKAPVVGAALGGLVVAQFFVSTEMLAITAIVVFVGVLCLAVARPRSVPGTMRRAAPGVLVAAGIALALLGYPVWAAVAGPRHFTGAVWAHVGGTAATLSATVEPRAELPGVAFISGGNGNYLGAGLLVVLALAAVVMWRSVALRTSLGLAAIAYVFSLGSRLHAGATPTAVPLPAALLGHIPLLDSVVPSRFAAMVDLFCGMALALVTDDARQRASTGSHVAAVRAPNAIDVPQERNALRPMTSRGVSSGALTRRALTTAFPVAVAAAALVPVALVPPWPYATATRTRPAVLASIGGVDVRRPDVVVYPDGATAASEEMVWQAQEGYRFALADGYAIVPGQDGRATESPSLDAVWLVFAAAELHRLHLPLSVSARQAMRADLVALHVDRVVVLAHRPGSRSVRRALTSALGHPHSVTRGATTWLIARRP